MFYSSEERFLGHNQLHVSLFLRLTTPWHCWFKCYINAEPYSSSMWLFLIGCCSSSGYLTISGKGLPEEKGDKCHTGRLIAYVLCDMTSHRTKEYVCGFIKHTVNIRFSFACDPAKHGADVICHIQTLPFKKHPCTSWCQGVMCLIALRKLFSL